MRWRVAPLANDTGEAVLAAWSQVISVDSNDLNCSGVTSSLTCTVNFTFASTALGCGAKEAPEISMKVSGAAALPFDATLASMPVFTTTTSPSRLSARLRLSCEDVIRGLPRLVLRPVLCAHFVGHGPFLFDNGLGLGGAHGTAVGASDL